MKPSSIVVSILVLLLLCSSLSIAQPAKQWSFGGAFGSSTQLSLSYNPTAQLRLSLIFGPYGDLTRTSSDRMGLSVIYYFDTSDNPFFIGFAPGITTQDQHTFIAAIPIGIEHKITDDFSLSFAGEIFLTKNEFNRTAGGVGISIGGSIHL